jgi:hypothetical protein
MKMATFFDTSPCSLAEVDQRFKYDASIALMTEAVRTSETSAYFYETTRRSIPEGCHLRNKFPQRGSSCSKSEVKLSHYSHAGDKGERCSSYSFLTSALDGVSGQHHAPTALYPLGKGPPVPIG